MAETEIKDRPSSIEVSQNAKGDYSFKVKIYYDDETVDQPIERAKEIYNELHTLFKDAYKQ